MKDATARTTPGSADAQAGQIADGAHAEASGSITSRLYARMRTDIITGLLAPGAKLKIDELRRRYEVGASPVREALSLLTSEVLVERIDQRGFRVVEISIREFEELLKTRIWLETRALRESIAHGGSNWEEQVVLATYRLSRVPRSQSEDRFVANQEWEDRHKRFHMKLLSACGSAILLKFCNQLYDQNTRYRHIAGPTAYPERDTTAEHGAICDAALARDADLAADLLTAHYERTSGFLKGLILTKT